MVCGIKAVGSLILIHQFPHTISTVELKEKLQDPLPLFPYGAFTLQALLCRRSLSVLVLSRSGFGTGAGGGSAGTGATGARLHRGQCDAAAVVLVAHQIGSAGRDGADGQPVHGRTSGQRFGPGAGPAVHRNGQVGLGAARRPGLPQPGRRPARRLRPGPRRRSQQLQVAESLSLFVFSLNHVLLVLPVTLPAVKYDAELDKLTVDVDTRSPLGGVRRLVASTFAVFDK